MTSTLPALERKEVAAPAPAVADVDPDTGEVTALAAITGGRPDEVGDVIVPGAFRRTLRERTPRLCVGHDWQRLAGRVVEARELLPGDPRLPRTIADGTPWPRDAGALWIRARYLPTREGREQREIARAFGPDMAYSIGYKVNGGGAKHRGGVRYIHDLSLFEVSPVLHGANRLAVQLDVKSAASGLRNAVAQLTCGGCGQTAGGSTGSVPRGTVWLCPSCCGHLTSLTGYLARNVPEALADTLIADGEDDEGDDGEDVLPDFADLDPDPADGEDEQDQDEPGQLDQDDEHADPLVTPVSCSLCGAGVGQVGDVPAGHDIVCPDCLNEVLGLADRLAGDRDPDETEPTADQEYRDAVAAERPLTMLGDGTLEPEDTGRGAGPRAFRPGAGGRARP